MDDIDQPRRRPQADDEDQPRRRPVEEDEDYPRDRAFRQGRPRPGGKKDVSVIGVISLVIGVISLALSLVPCLGLVTLPLPIIGAVLALVGILISAIGQREGLGIPVSGMAVNVVACVLPIALVMGFCGLGMRGAQQAAQQAMQQLQELEQAELERQEAEHRQQTAANVAVVGLLAAPQGQGPLLSLAVVNDIYPAVSPGPGATLQVNLNQLVREFELNPRQAERRYQDKILRIQGTIQQVRQDGNDTVVVLQSAPLDGNKVECEFTDVPKRDQAWLQINRPVVIEGTCEGLRGGEPPVWLSECRMVR
jgi:hypothetical protein